MKLQIDRNLYEFLEEYGLTKKFIAYVKNESCNMNIMIISSIVSSDTLDVKKKKRTCFEHVFSKAYQYIIIENKMCKKLQICFHQMYF